MEHVADWQCPRCLQWIQDAATHTCPMNTGTASYPAVTISPYAAMNLDRETKRLLERIAIALEKLAGL